jgi:hypothetical protein
MATAFSAISAMQINNLKKENTRKGYTHTHFLNSGGKSRTTEIRKLLSKPDHIKFSQIQTSNVGYSSVAQPFSFCGTF